MLKAASSLTIQLGKGALLLRGLHLTLDCDTDRLGLAQVNLDTLLTLCLGLKSGSNYGSQCFSFGIVHNDTT